MEFKRQHLLLWTPFQYHFLSVHPHKLLEVYVHLYKSEIKKSSNFSKKQRWRRLRCISILVVRDLEGGRINDHISGKHLSLTFLPATPLSWSWTLEGIFELMQRSSRALNLTVCVASGTKEKHENYQQSWWSELSESDIVKNKYSETWLCVSWKCTCFHWSKNWGG